VGGIYTVIKSKAPVSMEEMGEQFALIGPYNESCVRTEVELLEPHHHVMREVLDEMRAHGIKVIKVVQAHLFIKLLKDQSNLLDNYIFTVSV
jgi:hypothetical protein